MRWKRLLIGVVGLIVAALVGGNILVTRYDFNSLKPQLVQAVKERTGRELTLGGDMAVKFGLSPAPGQGGQQTRAAAPVTKRDKVFPQEPLPLGGLQLANATLEVYARQLFTPRLALDDLTLRLVLHDGHLIVQPLQARMGGGSLDGSVQLQPRGKATQVVLAVKMDQVDVGRMARELQVKDIFEGRLAATIAVQGQGDSVAAIMAGLNGKTALVLGKGRLDNKYIELLGADLGARPFKLGGTLAHPSLAVDVTQAALTVGKSVGGTLLFGPVGIAAALLSSNRGGPENACVQAIEAAKTGVKPAGTKPLAGVKDNVEKATEGLGTRLKKLFDR